MGGGRSGLFPGIARADVYQQSLFGESLKIRHRGVTYLPSEDRPNEEGGIGRNPSDKVHVLTVKEVLNKFMDYRFKKISASNLVRWLQVVLGNNHYYIEAYLRYALTNGLARLKATKTYAQIYNHERFLAEIEKIEAEILLE